MRVCRVYALEDESPWEIYEPFRVAWDTDTVQVISGGDLYTFNRRNIVAVIDQEVEEEK